jgi:hypothetical protein
MLVRGVIGHKIDDHFEMALMCLLKKDIERLQIAEERINIAVVGNIIAEVDYR